MSNEFPTELRYTKDHEWIRMEGDVAVIGVTAFAQAELGEIVFVDLPAKGRAVKAHESFCVLESTKVASDVYAPIGGTVSAVNTALTDSPDLVNKSPYQDGWLVKLDNVDASSLTGLLSAAEYQAQVGSN